MMIACYERFDYELSPLMYKINAYNISGVRN